MNKFFKLITALLAFMLLFFIPYDLVSNWMFILNFIIFGVPIVFLAAHFWLDLFEELFTYFNLDI